MFAKDGYTVIMYAFILAVLLAAGGFWIGSFWAYGMYVLSIFTIGFTLYFFRDPLRTPPDNADEVLLAPADGAVILLNKGITHEYFDKPCTQLSIFLSPLDVHVNRVPSSGKVTYVKYFPGKYLVAWHEKASELNERSEFGMVHPTGTKVFFRQITGFIARRIVYHLNEGDEVTAGDKFGMMKFGSRMDILVPDDFELHVKKGDVTIGGETVLGVFK